INYIAQTYQEMPSGIYLFSYSGNDTVPIGNISIPISLFDPVSKVQNLPPDIAMEYILPLGALLSDRQFDLLPEVYSTGRVVKSIARNAGVSFLAIGIIMGLHLGLSYKEVSDIKARVLSIRGQATPDIGSAINYMSSLTSMPIKEKIDLSGAEEFLVNLSNLVPPEIELENFKIIPTGGKWEIQMEGTSAIGNNAYTVIGMFVAQIKSIENMNVTESSMSVSEKTIKFTIKANHV
ncbi:MAG: hypothetical protein HZC45_01485, partial [Deltaproteobacteria bacterium]|nr:hypothetical protein [Deltaproteobacteria bacterium]